MESFKLWLGLNEAMKTETDIPKGVCLYYSHLRGALDIWFGDNTHHEIEINKVPDIDITRLPRSSKPAGRIHCIPVRTFTDDEWDDYQNEKLEELPPTVLMVRNVDANGGWGPLLYELAMEMATDEGGLISDRERTDSLAMAVWKQFFKRNDIEKHELPEHIHTNQAGFFSKEDLRVLNYRYTKEPTRINNLLKLGLWKPGNTSQRY